MTRLVLHVGSHKTATTSIQHALDAHREDARDHGVWYPDVRELLSGRVSACHRLVRKIQIGDAGAVSAFFGAIREGARPGETVVLSSEQFYNWAVTDGTGDYWTDRATFVERLRDCTRGFDTSILLYLRSRDRFAESRFGGLSRHLPREATFAQWREANMTEFDYDRHVATWADAFESVHVRRFEDAVSEGVLDAFMRELGSDARLAGTTWIRRSTDPRLLHWLRMHSHDPGQPGGRQGSAGVCRETSCTSPL